MGVFVGGQTWRVGYVVEEIAEAEYGNGNAKAPPDVGVVEDGFQLRSAMLFGFHGRLVVVDFVEFDFVGDGGVGGDAVGTGDEAVGEVEAVFAAGVHELDAGEEALEHGFAEHVDDGFALAVGLLDELVVDEVDAFEVEADALADGGTGAVALAEDLVVVAVGGFLEVGVLFGEFGEEGFFGLVGVLRLGLGGLPVFHGDEEGDVFDGVVVVLLGEGLFLAADAAFEGFDDEFFVEVVEAAVGGLGEAHAHGPAEGVLLGAEDGGFGFAAAGDEGQGEEDCEN